MTGSSPSEHPLPDAREEGLGAPERAGPDDSDTADARAVASDHSGMAVIDLAVLTAISDRLEQLRTLFETSAAENTERQQWVAQLTAQLADYRDDFVFKNVTSKIFRDLIQLHDTVGQTLDPSVQEITTKEDLLARLANFQKQLLKTFDRQGLEQIKSDIKTPFDGAEQEAIDVRLVSRPEDDGIVLESARCGFRYGLRLLRPESVIVGRYEAQKAEADG